MKNKSGQRHRAVVTVFIMCILVILSTVSCGSAGKKEKFARRLADNLRSSYSAELTFSVGTGSTEISGTAILSRNGEYTRLDITSPEPYSGLSIEYDISGAPSSVAVHFKGIDTTLPTAALSKINLLASLAADDFISVFSKVSGDSILEYDISESETGYCASFVYGNADAAVYFAENGDFPYCLEYQGKDISANITFDKFKLEIISDSAE